MLMAGRSSACGERAGDALRHPIVCVAPTPMKKPMKHREARAVNALAVCAESECRFTNPKRGLVVRLHYLRITYSRRDFLAARRDRAGAVSQNLLFCATLTPTEKPMKTTVSILFAAAVALMSVPAHAEVLDLS